MRIQTQYAQFRRLFAHLMGILVVAAALSGLTGCSREPVDTPDTGAASQPANAGELVILHAADLVRPFSVLERVMESRRSGLDVIREAGSSEFECRKVVDLGARADIVAVTDWALIDDMLMPDHASWAAAFARNRLVLIYGDHSKYRSSIDSNNWHEILIRDDVAFGYANPNMAPVGYRTLLCWKLADLHYNKASGSIYKRLRAACPSENVRPHCQELFALLQTGTLDYVFHYQSMAAQHNLQYLRLPSEIDLGDPALAHLYSSVEVTVGEEQTREKVGRPILYAATILKDADNRPAAIEFLRLLLQSEGRAILQEHEFEPIAPMPLPDSAAIPQPLRPLLDGSSP